MRFDDLHIDEIDSRYRSSSEWMSGCREVMLTIISSQVVVPAGFTIALGISLRAGPEAVGITFQSSEELNAELTATPPSLYLFERDNEPWLEYPEFSSNVEGDLLVLSNPRIKYIYFEYHEPYEEDFRRSLSIAYVQ
jgi:hypothetical protein